LIKRCLFCAFLNRPPGQFTLRAGAEVKTVCGQVTTRRQGVPGLQSRPDIRLMVRKSGTPDLRISSLPEIASRCASREHPTCGRRAPSNGHARMKKPGARAGLDQSQKRLAFRR
jgi:hypothetical protein